MKRGDEAVFEITDVAYGGAGIARHEGRVVFVPFTIPGETVRARIGKVTRGWMQAEALEILAASPDRVSPPCPVFGRCGGCAYQHIAYPRQLEIKTRQVSEALRRIGKFPAPPVEPARPSPLAYGYRNRITVHVVPPHIGFRGLDPRKVIDIRACLLAEESVNDALVRLRTKSRPRPGPATLRADPEARGFRQVNAGAAAVLATVVAELAGPADLLVDAYCGAGFFAKQMRGQFARVLGIDWDARSIEAAQRDAGSNEEYRAGDAAELLPGALNSPETTVVLLDPPAQGVAPAVIRTLLEIRPFRLVYVSCDPATLARDLHALSGAYELQRAVPVDMFPQTASIETACLLSAKQ
ncbi:MAG: class I SAM-dependent RNA methyltransferase [Chthoniobacterales bacterium]